MTLAASSPETTFEALIAFVQARMNIQRARTKQPLVMFAELSATDQDRNVLAARKELARWRAAQRLYQADGEFHDIQGSSRWIPWDQISGHYQQHFLDMVDVVLSVRDDLFMDRQPLTVDEIHAATLRIGATP